MTRTRALAASMIVTAFVVMAVDLTVAQANRNEGIANLQVGCLRGARRNVVLVNVWRAQAVANHIVATDPKQSRRGRRARDREVAALIQAVRLVDGQTDVSQRRGLRSPVDRRAVAAAGFSCRHAYPPSGLLP